MPLRLALFGQAPFGRDTLVRLGIIREAPPENRFWPEYLGRYQGFAPYPPGYRDSRP